MKIGRRLWLSTTAALASAALALALWGSGSNRQAFAVALSAVKDDAPIILLTHNPDIFPFVPPRVTLTVAGHTHGGQVRLPLFGRPVVTMLTLVSDRKADAAGGH